MSEIDTISAGTQPEGESGNSHVDGTSNGPGDERLLRRTRAELVGLLYAHAPFGLGAGIFVAAILSIVIAPAAPSLVTLLWLGSLLGVTLPRWILVKAYQRATQEARESEKWGKRFVAGTLASGLSWGCGSLLLIGYADERYVGFSTFILGGMAAAGIATIGSVWAAYASFSIPVLLPLAAVLAVRGDTLSLVLSTLTLVFMLMMLSTARRVSEVFRRDIELRLRNEQLVQSLTRTAEQLGRTNRELGQEAAVRQLAEEKLLLAAKVFEGSAEGIVIADPEGRVVTVNRAFTQITGYPESEAIGQHLGFLRSDLHDSAFYRNLWSAVERDGFWRGETWSRRKSGEAFPTWTAISAVRTAEHRLSHYVAIFSDISERKLAEERIEFLAHHDALTGLPNRILLRDRFDAAVARALRAKAKVALLFLDMDQFKAINDSFGHPAGDALLRQLAERIRGCVRGADTVCRQGGDEFVILLADVGDIQAISTVAEKLLAAFREPVEVEGYALSTACSIGISLYPDDGDGFDVLLQRADTAMYRAKSSGRNAFRFFTSEMNTNALERLKLQNRLRLALDRGEFFLHYQPQVRLADNQLVGIEALIRWLDPDLGLIAPGAFIPIAEESGLIVPIGHWVLNEVCRQNRAWQLAGLRCVPIAVNLSAIQLTRADFYATVYEALRSSGLPASLLELELTESILINDAECILETFKRVKALGVQLSIDDFGAGYSSLSYLRRFPVDKLKIDRSFVRDVTDGADEAAIARAVIQMARSLNLRTVAEGVETLDQVRFLRREGCHEAQGFLFSRPVPADDIGRLLAAPSLPWAILSRAA
jgi:diguanylate cyclase (GGDEF)-like protein/PAS domain S-box-containing protein